MSEYLNMETENGETVTVAIDPPKSEPVKYFWMISADFIRTLPEPEYEYHSNGYTMKTQETGLGFMADTYTAQPGETVTRLSLLVFAIRELLKSQNEGRQAAGKTVMFDASHVIVKAFDCGRNVL